MSVVHHESLEFIETPGGSASAAIATPSRGATEVSIIRQRQAPGGFNPVHTHDREEVLVVLAGTIDVTMDGATQALRPGDAIIVPAHTEHQLRNGGDETNEWLLVAPAGYRFFHATGEEASPEWAR